MLGGANRLPPSARYHRAPGPRRWRRRQAGADGPCLMRHKHRKRSVGQDIPACTAENELAPTPVSVAAITRRSAPNSAAQESRVSPTFLRGFISSAPWHLTRCRARLAQISALGNSCATPCSDCGLTQTTLTSSAFCSMGSASKTARAASRLAFHPTKDLFTNAIGCAPRLRDDKHRASGLYSQVVCYVQRIALRPGVICLTDHMRSAVRPY